MLSFQKKREQEEEEEDDYVLTEEDVSYFLLCLQLFSNNLFTMNNHFQIAVCES